MDNDIPHWEGLEHVKNSWFRSRQSRDGTLNSRCVLIPLYILDNRGNLLHWLVFEKSVYLRGRSFRVYIRDFLFSAVQRHESIKNILFVYLLEQRIKEYWNFWPRACTCECCRFKEWICCCSVCLMLLPENRLKLQCNGFFDGRIFGLWRILRQSLRIERFSFG